ncbi:hypothetical protein [Virgibacillus proomii]|uniref:hypothetical protein n=1 Tax=Virgibacillus proomii TaxID=84407 RepID=UPI001C1245EF|nr:hypothetical protein [Virgibacillus proomii]MBU5265384.1 hypothetical protein [Virgibacillus proomii]
MTNNLFNNPNKDRKATTATHRDFSRARELWHQYTIFFKAIPEFLVVIPLQGEKYSLK